MKESDRLNRLAIRAAVNFWSNWIGKEPNPDTVRWQIQRQDNVVTFTVSCELLPTESIEEAVK